MTCLVKTEEILRFRDDLDELDRIIERIEDITEEEVIYLKVMRKPKHDFGVTYMYSEFIKGDESFFIDKDEDKIIFIERSKDDKIDFIRISYIDKIKIFGKKE